MAKEAEWWTSPQESESGRIILVTGRKDVEKFRNNKKYSIRVEISWKYTGQEDALEESVLTLLQDYDMVDECIIGSMNKGILQKMKELEPGISTVFIAHDLEEEDYELDYADSYSFEGRNLTVDMVDAIHYCGKSVYGWTANTSGAMLRIVNCGADGVITDDVRLLQTFLREQACRKAFASVY